MNYSTQNTHVLLKEVLWGCFGYQIGLQLAFFLLYFFYIRDQQEANEWQLSNEKNKSTWKKKSSGQ